MSYTSKAARALRNVNNRLIAQGGVPIVEIRANAPPCQVSAPQSEQERLTIHLEEQQT